MEELLQEICGTYSTQIGIVQYTAVPMCSYYSVFIIVAITGYIICMSQFPIGLTPSSNKGCIFPHLKLVYLVKCLFAEFQKDIQLV